MDIEQKDEFYDKVNHNKNFSLLQKHTIYDLLEETESERRMAWHYNKRIIGNDGKWNYFYNGRPMLALIIGVVLLLFCDISSDWLNNVLYNRSLTLFWLAFPFLLIVPAIATYYFVYSTWLISEHDDGPEVGIVQALLLFGFWMKLMEWFLFHSTILPWWLYTILQSSQIIAFLICITKIEV
jgi:hypothetical protein